MGIADNLNNIFYWSCVTSPSILARCSARTLVAYTSRVRICKTRHMTRHDQGGLDLQVWEHRKVAGIERMTLTQTCVHPPLASATVRTNRSWRAPRRESTFALSQFGALTRLRPWISELSTCVAAFPPARTVGEFVPSCGNQLRVFRVVLW